MRLENALKAEMPMGQGMGDVYYKVVRVVEVVWKFKCSPSIGFYCCTKDFGELAPCLWS